MANRMITLEVPLEDYERACEVTEGEGNIVFTYLLELVEKCRKEKGMDEWYTMQNGVYEEDGWYEEVP